MRRPGDDRGRVRRVGRFEGVRKVDVRGGGNGRAASVMRRRPRGVRADADDRALSSVRGVSHGRVRVRLGCSGRRRRRRG
eukprot:31363-Pelagococcus_subviridis.AAC.6